MLVESELDRVTAFTLHLPRVSAPASPEDHPEPEPLVDGHGTSGLVVGNDMEARTFEMRTLNDLGYATVLPASAEQALAELARGADRFGITSVKVVEFGWVLTVAS